MSVAKFTQPNYTTQGAVVYKTNIDAAIQALAEMAANFAPHAADTPNMTVVVDAGKLWDGSTYTSKAQQTTSTITAPSTNPRIDRVCLDTAGDVTVVTGSEAASPSAPDIPAGYYPLCQFQLETSTTAITNSMITDERPFVQTIGTTLTKSLWFSEGSSVASATDCNIWTTDGNTVHLTGTTTVTDWGTAPQAGAFKWVICDAATPLTYDATTNDLNTGGDDYTATAGDVLFIYARSASSYKVTIFKYGVRDVDRQKFTSSGTWTKPTGFGANSFAVIEAWGGGGSGGRGNGGTNDPGGGGGGGYNTTTLPLSSLGSTETVTIGAGGAAVSGSAQNGNAGGNTTFGAHLTAYGGGRGGGDALADAAGGGGAGEFDAGGNASGTTAGNGGNGIGGAAGGAGGAAGSAGNVANTLYAGAGGGGSSSAGARAYYGGGGGAGDGGIVGGGSSVLGGNGGDPSTDGVQPGGGGGGSTNTTSGKGGDGQVIVTVYNAD